MSCDIRNRRALQRRAFSLVEIMIVIVIIGLLAGVVTINVRNYLTRARQNIARQEISTIATALDEYWAVNSRYPTNDEGLDVLTQATEETGESFLDGGPSALIDPWDNPYQYNCPAAEAPYEVISLGADGREGGSGAEADISSVDLK